MSTRKNKKRIGWIILVIAVIVIGGFLFAARLILNNRANNVATIRSVVVQTGTIEKTVTGTGNLTTEETLSDVKVLDGLTVASVLVEPGDHIASGTLLATFDSVALQAAVRDAKTSLSSLDSQLNVLKDKKESIYLTTSISGRVKQVFVEPGDGVEAIMAGQGALMVLSLDGKMRVDFAPADIQGLQAGDEVLVTLADNSQLTGTISSISSSRCSVTVSDAMAAAGGSVTISRKDKTPLGQGVLVINQPLSVMGTTGIVDAVLKNVNDTVQAGTRLIRLQEAELSWNYQTLYQDRLEWASRLDMLISYSIKGGLVSPVAGTVRKIGLVEGSQTGTGLASGANAASSGSSASAADHLSAAFTFGSDQQMKLSVQVDELDIALLSLQQSVQITIDALPGLKLSGAISDISESGVISQGGSTSYKVTVDLPENAQMKEGMTATAVIIVEHRENVVRLPLEALQESGSEQFVYVGTPKSVTDLGEKRLVTLGVSDGQYVEVKSGLSAGEQVNYLFNDGSASLFPFGGRFNRSTTTTSGSNAAASLD